MPHETQVLKFDEYLGGVGSVPLLEAVPDQCQQGEGVAFPVGQPEHGLNVVEVNIELAGVGPEWVDSTHAVEHDQPDGEGVGDVVVVQGIHSLFGQVGQHLGRAVGLLLLRPVVS